MEYGLVPKIYDVDYSFIVKNYLNPELWDKEWNIYCYKDIIIKLSLSYINVSSKRITFQIKLVNEKEGYDTSYSADYYIQQSNIEILKKQINGAIFRLLEYYEERVIKWSDDYQDLADSFNDEDDRLRDIATNFLDENGVTNEDIREVYINNYIANNSQWYDTSNKYLSAKQYVTLPDYFLTFTKITEDEVRYKKCYEKIAESLNQNVINEILKTAKMVCDFDSDYEELMIDNLEAI